MRTSHIICPLPMQCGLAAFALCLVPAAPALAQANAPAQAEAIVLRPLSFFKVNDLDLF